MSPGGGERRPLVSCLLVTGGRNAFAARAVAFFERQDHPERELVVVDGGEVPLAGDLPPDPRIRYVRVPPGSNLGARRNRACELARGEILVLWDDDDWYSPRRLSVQVAPILAGAADLTGLETLFFEPGRWTFWRCRRDLHRRLFAGDVAGGTLAFRRGVWERLARFPECSLAEDAIFLREALRQGARLTRIAQDDGDPLFLYVRHGANTWTFPCGSYLDPHGWQRLPEPPLPAGDRAFYAGLGGAASPGSPGRSSGLPRVSCLMPTAGRRAFVPQAVRCFLRQDYPETELVVVDGGEDPVEDLVAGHPRVRYVRPRSTRSARSLGELRNLACEAASGDLLLHWDDDDWHAPWRVRAQAARLARGDAEACGLRRLHFYEPASGRLWLYGPPARFDRWVAGGTLAYTRESWRRHPFPAIQVGEDNEFVRAIPPGRLAGLSDPGLYVALIHPANTSPKRPAPPLWQPQAAGRAAELLGEDLGAYRGFHPGLAG